MCGPGLGLGLELKSKSRALSAVQGSTLWWRGIRAGEDQGFRTKRVDKKGEELGDRLR